MPDKLQRKPTEELIDLLEPIHYMSREELERRTLVELNKDMSKLKYLTKGVKFEDSEESDSFESSYLDAKEQLKKELQGSYN